MENLFQTGITEDGKKVVSFFKMYDTIGLPISSILDMIATNNMVPDFYTFYSDARNVGWTSKRISASLEESIKDVFGTDYWLEVEKRLDILQGK